jgi:hypothetical protein
MTVLLPRTQTPYNTRLIIARSVYVLKKARAKLNLSIKGNERVRSQAKLRSNLLSLINWREIFRQPHKNHTMFNQSREIAEKPLARGGIFESNDDNGMIRPAKGFFSGMQQCLAKSIFSTLSTEPRNDKGRYQGHKLQPLDRICNGSCLAIEGNLYV